MDFELSDRVAIITGCSVGIGRDVARVLASEGVQTVVIARRGGLLATLQDEIVAAGGPRPQAMAVDVTEPHTPRSIVEETLAHFGDPADMAYLVACLCSPKARYITGERIHVDGGYRRAY